MNRLILIIIISVLSACVFKTKHRGFVFKENIENELKTIKTVKDLESKIGTPQVKTEFGEKIWIYYSVDENYRGPLPVKYDNKKVLLVWVNGSNIKKTKILTDKDLPNIEITEGTTKVPAEIELNAFEELFKNIGRFKPAGV